jgi:hypothetical protein
VLAPWVLFVAKFHFADQNSLMVQSIFERPNANLKIARWIFILAAIYGIAPLGSSRRFTTALPDLAWLGRWCFC